MTPPPIIWVVAGNDSAGGAGLSADQRAAAALGVHACPIVTAATAQNSLRVSAVEPVSASMLQAQFDTLGEDMTPAVIKTGLLANAQQVHAVAREVMRRRRDGPVALVIDPVMGASTGRRFMDDTTLDAVRDELIPLADLITPNRVEAARLCRTQQLEREALPGLAARLRETGARAVAITGGDRGDETCSHDWIDTPQARGWLSLPRLDARHGHGTGCTFASAAAAAMARGFVAADALVLAKMATTAGLKLGWPAGSGAGHVRVPDDFALDAPLLPVLSWDDHPASPRPHRQGSASLGLYAIVDSAERVRRVVEAGVRTVQLRIKLPPGGGDTSWWAHTRQAIVDAHNDCVRFGAELFVNDHWRLARELGVRGVHLGQEDLLALSADDRALLGSPDVDLGISSHSLWELCRTQTLAPRYVACGPIWPTLTKQMPWKPQGLDNLTWWNHMAGAPVVAIGGILDPWHVEQAASCGVDGVCIVRALGDDPETRIAELAKAFNRGHHQPQRAVPRMPEASLAP